MNNEENIMELEARPTDKENQAHSNEANEKNSTTNERKQPTKQSKTSE